MSKPFVGHRMTYADPECNAEVERLRQRIEMAQQYHYAINDLGLHRDVCVRCNTVWPCRTAQALSDV